jgi:hypothetical protein
MSAIPRHRFVSEDRGNPTVCARCPEPVNDPVHTTPEEEEEMARQAAAAAAAPLPEDPESQPRKGRRPRQQEIPGAEQISKIPALTKAVKALKEMRSEWQELGGRVAEQRDLVARLMHDHGLTTYPTSGLVVTLVPGKEKVKVKEVGGDEDED